MVTLKVMGVSGLFCAADAMLSMANDCSKTNESRRSAVVDGQCLEGCYLTDGELEAEVGDDDEVQ
jgi:hypothetical protein